MVHPYNSVRLSHGLPWKIMRPKIVDFLGTGQESGEWGSSALVSSPGVWGHYGAVPTLDRQWRVAFDSVERRKI